MSDFQEGLSQINRENFRDALQNTVSTIVKASPAVTVLTLATLGALTVGADCTQVNGDLPTVLVETLNIPGISELTNFTIPYNVEAIDEFAKYCRDAKQIAFTEYAKLSGIALILSTLIYKGKDMMEEVKTWSAQEFFDNLTKEREDHPKLLFWKQASIPSLIATFLYFKDPIWNAILDKIIK